MMKRTESSLEKAFLQGCFLHAAVSLSFPFDTKGVTAEI